MLQYNWIKFKNSLVKADQIAEFFVEPSLDDDTYDFGVRLNSGGVTLVKRFPTIDEANKYANSLFGELIKPTLPYTKILKAEEL